MLSDRNGYPNHTNLIEPPRLFNVSRGVVILWMIVAGLVVFFIPLVMINSNVKKETETLVSQLNSITESLTLVPTPNPTVKGLMNELEQVQQKSAGIRSVYPTIAAGYTDWNAVIAAIANYNPDDLALVSLAQENRSITLNGRAINDEVVVAYARALEESGQFNSVVVQSLKVVSTPFSPQISPTPTPTLIPTAVPVTPTLTTQPTPEGTVVSETPTPDLRDQFEDDESEATTIFMGEPQSHTFYPIYDVDTVKFLAKADRYYRVYTTDLSPGVDTYISVNVEGQIYTNDDASSGTLNSMVEFQVQNGYDSEAVVRITNRGIYGTDKGYDVIAEEVITTPTPTNTPKTKTPSPTPTNTYTPSPTSTPTRDLRDEYEPDDVTPKPIAVGETQEHNFFPSGDIDRMSFYAKSGRHYQILTSNLTLGVDTKLQVNLNNQVYTNDDYEPAGTSNYASGLCLYSPVNKTATMTVTNVQGQYGSAMRYDLSVNEAPELVINHTTLKFGPVIQGGADPASKKIEIENSSAALLNWTAETNQGWLSVSPTSGVTPDDMTVSVDIDGLTSGSYQATIVISGTDLCTRNNPKIVTVNLEISASTMNGAGRSAGVSFLAPDILSHFVNSDMSQPVLEPDSFAAFPESLQTIEKAVEFIIVLELKAVSL
ncbi:MAG: PilN domain-containing protein [Anaerolineales bacterium]|nr:PilN domain-containing protein [Anaerolineales bacterium]